MNEPELTVEVDLGPVFGSLKNRNYCETHIWDSHNTPCIYCTVAERKAEKSKHETKQKRVTCRICCTQVLTYWGSAPYTCRECLPTEQHMANLTTFFEELDS